MTSRHTTLGMPADEVAARWSAVFLVVLDMLMRFVLRVFLLIFDFTVVCSRKQTRTASPSPEHQRVSEFVVQGY